MRQRSSARSRLLGIVLIAFVAVFFRYKLSFQMFNILNECLFGQSS